MNIAKNIIAGGEKLDGVSCPVWKRLWVIQLVVAAGFLLAGGLYTWWEVRDADRQMRTALLDRTRLMAEAVSPERIKRLSGSGADLARPEYLRIKQQLSLLKRDNADIRFVYLMGYRPDGTIFFFADNEPSDSPGYSPPGQRYAEGTAEYQKAMREGTEIVEGPTADQWGVWVSAQVPVKDPRTGQALAGLGVDVEAGLWRKSLILAGLPGAWLTLILTGIAFAWVRLYRRRRFQGGASPRWLQYFEVIGVVVIGIALSLFAAWRIHSQESISRNRLFQQLAFSETAQIAQVIENIRSAELEGLSAFFHHSTAVRRSDFFHYFCYLTDNPLVQAWLWAPAVPAAEAASFEARIRREDDDSGFRIWPSPAPAAAEVRFPVLYVEPGKDNHDLAGFDLMSEPKLRAALQEAKKNGMAAATDPVWSTLFSEKGAMIWVFRPVFFPEQEDRLLGMAAVVLRIPSIQSRSEVRKDMVEIGFSVLREEAGTRPLSLFGIPAYFRARDDVRRYLFSFGKVFCFSARPGVGFIRSYPLWRHKIILIAGLFFTAALALIAYLITRRRSELERLVLERTEKLGESEFRFRQLCRHSRTLVWDIDEQGLFTYVNDVSKNLLGYRFGEMVGIMRFHDLCPEPDRRIFRDSMIALSRAKQAFRNVEIRLETKDKRVIWVSAEGMPLFGPNGRLFGYRGECIDITSRKMAEQEKERQVEFQKILTEVASTYINLPLDQLDAAINHSLAEFGAFLDIDRFSVFEFDSGRRLCSNTREWCAPGIPPRIDRLQNIPYSDLSWWVEALCSGRTIDSSDAKKLPLREEIGKAFGLEEIKTLICVPLMDGDRCLGFVGFDSIEKEHSYTEEEARLLNVFAQMLVNVHARCLEEAALLHSRKLAEAASRAKSEFLTHMSHEIRTPINGVIGVTDLLRDTRLDNAQQNLVDIINSSGKLLLELINDILDFSRIEAGKIELNPGDFNLDELLEGVTGGLALSAHAKNVELVVAVSPEVPARLCGDSLRLRQVLMNLAGNAVKFTDRGEIVLEAFVESQTADSVVVRFTVRDTGIGVERQQQPFLFDPFFQADSSVKRKYGGTGLGLPITKGLVERMEGTMRFSSQVGVGSEFSFAVPLARAAVEDSAILPAPEWRSARILVVDDNPAVREALMRELASHSLRPSGTADPAAVPDLLRRAQEAGEPFRAVLIDWVMPEKDPVALAAEIRRDAAFDELCLIAMIPLGTRLEDVLPTAVGFCCSINKPINRTELRALLRACPEAESEAEAVAEGASATPEPESDSADILLADDNTVNQKVMLFLLKKLGVRADVAGNGFEVLQKLTEKPYRLVLMDVQMPDLDGLEATRRIRDPESPVRNHRIPVIAVTAHALDGYQDICRAAGMDDYLTKPVTPDRLREVLERWLPGFPFA